MLKSLLTLIAASFLVISCERFDDTQQQHIRVYTALRQFVAETQASVFEQTLTNQAQLPQWVESYPSSGRPKAAELRSICNTIWVNGDFDVWLFSMRTNYRVTSITALVAEYQLKGTNCLIGITFSGDLVDQQQPPNVGFIKLNLNRETTY